MLAPLIGGQVLWFLGWRAIFWVLAGVGVIGLAAAFLSLPETLRPEYRQPLVLSSVLRRFGELFRHRTFMGYAFTGTFQFSALLSFLSGSPFVFIERYGVSPQNFGLIFGGMVVFMTLGSLLNARFAPVVGAGRILRYAVIVPAVAGTSAVVLGVIEARHGSIGMWPFILCIGPQIATISLIGPNSMAMALQRYPHMAGTASSLMGVMQFGIGAVFGALVGQLFDGTILPMVAAMGTAGVLCLLSHRLLVRGG
jgi:DHA1 family bicyclomycin/chloramphenicol resistance-like MFS transporter